MIARDGTNNGAWIHSRTLWVQNEDTAKLPDLVDRMPLDELLASVQVSGPEVARAWRWPRCTCGRAFRSSWRLPSRW